jgi:putative ABC transport system permease protein
MLHGFGRDLALAARRRAATPLFTTFAVLSLGVGVGVTTTAYSLVDATFFRALGVTDEDTLAFVATPENGRIARRPLSWPDVEDLRASQQSFAALAASTRVALAVVSPSTTELFTADAVSGNYFSTLGVQAAIGRVIQPADDEQAARVVVLGHALWRSRFGASKSVIGQSVRLSGHQYEIVGVLPDDFEGFTGGFRGTRLWIPLGTHRSLAPQSTSKTPERDRRLFDVVGRLRPGVSAKTASTELASIAAALDRTHPQRLMWTPRNVMARGWSAKPLRDADAEQEMVTRFGFILVGLVGLVLAVACTNLANLMLARGTLRHQEFAIRRALGASRWRLVREQLAESVLLAAAGAIGSYLIVRQLTHFAESAFPVAASWSMSLQPSTDASVVALAVGALLVSLVVFGLEPAFELTRSSDVRGALASASGSVGIPKARRQRMLLRWQVAVSAAFFIIATMCVKYTIAEARHDPGMEVSRLAIASLNFYTLRWDEARVKHAVDRLLTEAEGQDSIATIAVSTGLPFGTNSNPSARLSTTDKPFIARVDYPSATVVAATPGLFGTIGVPVLRGRAFDAGDSAASLPVAVLNETASLRLFGTTQSVGKTFLFQGRLRGIEEPIKTLTVVGIARDTDSSYFSPRRGGVAYLPLTQHYDPFLTVVARARYDTATTLGDLRKVIRAVDPDIAMEQSGEGRAILTGPYAFLRAMGFTALALGGLTLALAMVGLFGIQSHAVAHRTREIGVRMTFGATARQIKAMVLRDGYAPVLQGLAIGLFIGFAGRAVIRAYLDAKVSLIDPWVFALVPIPLVLAAFFACYLPARRASRVDPNVALRHL